MKVRKTVTILASFACLSSAASIAVAGEKMTGSGHNANQNVSTDVMERADGGSVMRLHDASVVMGNNAGNPFHLSSLDCYSTYVLPSGAENGPGAGYCDGIDQDGDVWWITFKGDFAGGMWNISGGTGKFDGMTGGGSYTAAAQMEGGRSFTTWDGTWETK